MDNQHKLTKEEMSRGGTKSKRKPFDERMKDFLNDFIDEKDPDKGTIEDALRKALIKYGLKGNIQAIREIFDRTYGKAKQDISLDSNGEIKIILDHKKEGEV